MDELDDVDIRQFKLSSGDEIVGMVKADDPTSVTVMQPLKLNSSNDEDFTSYSFVEWIPLSKEPICAISKLHIITFVECNNFIKEKYVRMFTDENGRTSVEDFIDLDAKCSDSDFDDEYDFDSIEPPTSKAKLH
jgi:hypothetical protein